MDYYDQEDQEYYVSYDDEDEQNISDEQFELRHSPPP